MLMAIKIFGYGFAATFLGLWALFYGLFPETEPLLYLGVRTLVATVLAHTVIVIYNRIRYREHYAEMRRYRMGR